MFGSARLPGNVFGHTGGGLRPLVSSPALGGSAATAMDALKRQADKLVEEQQASDEIAKTLTKKLADSQLQCRLLTTQLKQVQQDNTRLRCSSEDGAAQIKAVEQKQSGLKALFECHRDSAGSLLTKTQQVEELRAELTISFDVRFRNVEAMAKRVQHLAEKYCLADAELQSRQAQLQQASAQIECLQSESAAAEKQQRLLQEDLENTQAHQETLSDALAHAKEQAESLAEQLKTSQAEASKLRASNSDLQLEVETRTSELQSATKLLTQLRGEHGELQKQCHRQREEAATAAAAASNMQVSLSARLDTASARLKELELALDAELAKVEALGLANAESSEQHKIQLTDKEEVEAKLQAVLDEQQAQIAQLNQELQSATSSATESAAKFQDERDSLHASLAASTEKLGKLEAELSSSHSAAEAARSEGLAALETEKRNSRRAAMESAQKMDDYKERLAKELQDREVESQAALASAQQVAKEELQSLVKAKQEVENKLTAELKAAQEAAASTLAQNTAVQSAAKDAAAAAAANAQALQTRLHDTSDKLHAAEATMVEETTKLRAAHEADIKRVEEASCQNVTKAVEEACSQLQADLGAQLQAGAEKLAIMERQHARLQGDLAIERRNAVVAARAAASELAIVTADLEDKAKLLAQISMAAHPGSTPRKSTPAKRPTAEYHPAEGPVHKRANKPMPPRYNASYQPAKRRHHTSQAESQLSAQLPHDDVDDESNHSDGNIQHKQRVVPQHPAASSGSDSEEDTQEPLTSSKPPPAPIKACQQRPMKQGQQYEQDQPRNQSHKAVKKLPRRVQPTTSGRSGRSTRFQGMATSLHSTGGKRHQGKVSKQHSNWPSSHLKRTTAFESSMQGSLSHKTSHHDLAIFGAKMAPIGGIGDNDPFNFAAVSPSP